MPHNLARPDVNLAALGQELSSKLGREVALTARLPGQLDEEGNDLPGVLIVLDAKTGEELDADDVAVTKAVQAHKPPLTAQERRAQAIASAEKKATAGDTNGALADVLAILRGETSRPQPQPSRP